MHNESKKFLEDIISKVKSIAPDDRLEDGSVEISVNDNDIKDILSKKVLRGSVKTTIEKDLITAGLDVKICANDDMKIIVPKDKIECKTIRYSDIKEKETK